MDAMLDWIDRVPEYTDEAAEYTAAFASPRTLLLPQSTPLPWNLSNPPPAEKRRAAPQMTMTRKNKAKHINRVVPLTIGKFLHM
eukprot:CAMPEP_0206512288 /NCGR_PEP_ID=MMETSP0324_2-20121206/60790_1 /ASSEMBLY_ACC=CAM_ASM_000836 /TAXON_ID=2866 /ORGANISM="Crypthecodinium cohnii, Strain Seligo" /LENGTH=83 /DNA_ID=CAMNT_0054004217 /DNA_START=201 /DNA_END=452 /DNA_ORIENTATION=+